VSRMCKGDYFSRWLVVWLRALVFALVVVGWVGVIREMFKKGGWMATDANLSELLTW
jgi:hypothetical protein